MNCATIIPLGLVLAAGALSSMQSACSRQLADQLGTPLRAALVNFISGALILLSVVSLFALRTGPPGVERMVQTPLHLWVIGGALGPMLFMTATWATPKIGVGACFAALYWVRSSSQPRSCGFWACCCF